MALDLYIHNQSSHAFVVSYVAFDLSLFLPHFILFGCLLKAGLRDCDLS